MFSAKKIEFLISAVLTLGIFLSFIFVLSGGLWYLIQHGAQPLNLHSLQIDPNQKTNIELVFKAALSFSPLGMIEFGLLILVGTQILRVAMLLWFYSAIKDYWFIAFSCFILLTMLFGFFK